MIEALSRLQVDAIVGDIAAENSEVVDLTPDVMQTGSELLPTYPALNVFEAMYLGNAITLKEPIVSMETLYPRITEIDHRDPQTL